MQRYEIRFNEATRHGLKIDARVGANAQAFEVCKGLRATPFGLKDFIHIEQPMTDSYITTTLSETIAYPYPQLFRGKAVTLLCFSDAVYEVDESNWTATELTFYDAADFGDATPGAKTITADGPWHFMDFHTTWALFNGTTSIFKTGYYSKPIATTAVTIGTGCSIKSGRAVMAGFNPSNFYALADWPSYWETLNANAPSEIRQKAEMMAAGAGTNWVWWSTIGGGDLLWLISKDLYLNDTKPMPEMITNGSFTGSAAGWTLGTDWAYGSNKITATAASLFSDTIQSAASMAQPVIAGNSYSVTYTVANRSAGTIRIAIGAAPGTLRSTNGTFTETIVAAADNADLRLIADGFTGDIDNVSMVLVQSDSYNGTMSPWREIMQRNEFGMAVMPWQGDVLKVMRIGDACMVYGNGGVSAIVPYSTPVATFGVRDLQGLGRNVGVAGRSAAGGGIYEHVFVDSSGELWRVKGDLTAEHLGYGWVFSQMLDDPIIVSHDPQRNEYYISGEIDSTPVCYVLNNQGLSQAPWCPTNVQFAEGGLVAIMPGDDVDGVEIVTTRFGGNSRRHVDQVLSVALTTVDTDATGWTVVVEYRFQKSEDWVASAGVVTDARGVARMNVSGLEFRVKLTHPDRTKADLDNIEVEMMRGGKRNLAIMAP